MSTVELTEAELEGIGRATVRAATRHPDWPGAMSHRVRALPPIESRSRPAFGSDRSWQRDVWLRIEFDLRQRHYGLPSEPATESEHADVLRRAKYAIAQTLLAPVPFRASTSRVSSIPRMS
jgi:hypothetical protein